LFRRAKIDLPDDLFLIVLHAPLGGRVVVGCCVNAFIVRGILATRADRIGTIRFGVSAHVDEQVAEVLIGTEFIHVVATGWIRATGPEAAIVELDALTQRISEDHGSDSAIADRVCLAFPIGCGEFGCFAKERGRIATRFCRWWLIVTKLK
jgi:hypothetical protein